MQVIWVIYKIPDKKYNWNQRKEEDFFIDFFYPEKFTGMKRNVWSCINLESSCRNRP